jgi:transposase
MSRTRSGSPTSCATGCCAPDSSPTSRSASCALTRTRTTLVDERAAAINRLQMVLEDANLTLAGAATDLAGASGRAILAALLAGETDPVALAELAKGRLRTKRAALERALSGRLTAHHRLLLTTHLAHIDFLDEEIARLSAAIAERLRPLEDELARLDTIPGVDRQTAEVLLAEIGAEMARFPTSGHLASWAGMCPGQHVSAGKRLGGRSQRGSPWLRSALTEAAWGAVRMKGPYLAAQYRRVAARRGKQRAIVAVGHSILVSVYHLLAEERDYADLGGNFFDERERALVHRRLVRRLEQLGLTVTIEPAPAPAPAA